MAEYVVSLSLDVVVPNPSRVDAALAFVDWIEQGGLREKIYQVEATDEDYPTDVDLSMLDEERNREARAHATRTLRESLRIHGLATRILTEHANSNTPIEDFTDSRESDFGHLPTFYGCTMADILAAQHYLTALSYAVPTGASL